MSYSSQIEKHRKEKDAYFGKHPHSPLSHHDQHNFKGLNYYPVNEDLRFEVTLQPEDEVESIEMQTSDGSTRYYDRIGYLEFSVENLQKYNLVIFKRN